MSKRTASGARAPAITTEQFRTMLTALCRVIYNREPLDATTAKDIANALYTLRNIYDAELRKTLPHVSERSWQQAAVARFLHDNLKVRQQDACWLAMKDPTGTDIKRIERHFRKLRGDPAKLTPMVRGTALEIPDPHELHEAVARLRKLERQRKESARQKPA